MAKRHPIILILDILIFAFAAAELVEAWFGIGLHMILTEAALQMAILAIRSLAVWHAWRHL
jgi:hypothetical protein